MAEVNANTWRYRVEIQTIYSGLRSLDFLKKLYFSIYLKKDTAIYIAKNAYFDSIKCIKMNRILVVDEDSRGAAARSVTVKPTGCGFDPHSRR